MVLIDILLYQVSTAGSVIQATRWVELENGLWISIIIACLDRNSGGQRSGLLHGPGEQEGPQANYGGRAVG